MPSIRSNVLGLLVAIAAVLPVVAGLTAATWADYLQYAQLEHAHRTLAGGSSRFSADGRAR